MPGIFFVVPAMIDSLYAESRFTTPVPRYALRNVPSLKKGGAIFVRLFLLNTKSINANVNRWKVPDVRCFPLSSGFLWFMQELAHNLFDKGGYYLCTRKLDLSTYYTQHSGRSFWVCPLRTCVRSTV